MQSEREFAIADENVAEEAKKTALAFIASPRTDQMARVLRIIANDRYLEDLAVEVPAEDENHTSMVTAAKAVTNHWHMAAWFHQLD